MSTPLEVTLILVLVAVAVGLVPLLFQLRRTIRTLEAFLVSATKDLGQIADDVHASRLRMDLLAATIQNSMDEISGFTRVLGEAGRALKEVHARVHDTIASVSRTFGDIAGGASTVLSLFKGKPTTYPTPQEQ